MADPTNEQAERRDANLRYSQRRKAARELLASQIIEFTHHAVELDDISSTAIAEAQCWRRAYPEDTARHMGLGKVVNSFSPPPSPY
jgi:hypothetical protein